MVFVFVTLTLVFQCLTLYSLVTMSKRVHAIESRNESDNDVSYLKQLANLSLRGMNNGPESVNSSKVSTTWRTNHLYTNDEVLGL